MTRLAAVLAALLAAVAALAVPVALVGPGVAPAAAQPTGDRYPTLGLPPTGANDWACRPTTERPYPAVIVHGTFGDQKSLLDGLSLALKDDGYCVYALDYGDRGTGPIEESAGQLDGFVDEVLASTGADRVHLVGHSQGGMMPRFYEKNLGGDGLVEDLVGLAPSNHGTSNPGALASGGSCVACTQQASGSEFLTALNTPDETPGDVDYTQVVTERDEVVVPYTSGFLAADPRSVDITLQDRCPAEATEHLLIPTSRQAIAWVLDAFGREGPADPTAPIGCLGGR
jgi:triacylglycerol esterase/lipase EstA (alpha/beta hydrolase family)